MDPIKTVEEYLRAVTIRGDLALFRGQPVDEPLLPKIFRNCGKEFPKDLESRLFWRFRRKAAAYVGVETETDLDWLAIAQHYGLPTRLLDWSSKPLSALWFAVSQKPKEGEWSPVVWIVDALQDDIVFRDRRQDRVGDIKTGDVLPDPFDVKQTLVVFPNHITGRIAAQDGCFTLHPDRDCFRHGQPTAFEENRRYVCRKKKIVVSPKHADALRRELNDLGVNEARLFPDMIGLCRHLAWDHGVRVEQLKRKAPPAQ